LSLKERLRRSAPEGGGVCSEGLPSCSCESVYASACVCAYLCVYLYRRVLCVCAFLCVYLYMRVLCMCVCMYVYGCLCMYAWVWVCVCASATFTPFQVIVCLPTCVCVCMTQVLLLNTHSVFPCFDPFILTFAQTGLQPSS